MTSGRSLRATSAAQPAPLRRERHLCERADQHRRRRFPAPRSPLRRLPRKPYDRPNRWDDTRTAEERGDGVELVADGEKRRSWVCGITSRRSGAVVLADGVGHLGGSPAARAYPPHHSLEWSRCR